MGRYGLTRRRFVAGSAVGLTALGLGLGASTREAGAATTADVLIVGGGVGGVGAALGALRLDRTVILTEETDWIGGQLTAQAVPPDENPWIEGTGCTATYRDFRNRVRQYYRANYPLRRGPSGYPYLNPGAGNVSALCHEAPVALAVITEMLRPYVASGKLTIYLRHRPINVDPNGAGDGIDSVIFTNLANGSQVTLAGLYVLDATELGDLLPLAGVDHVTGAESKAQTNEPKALSTADPLDQQAISWCFALEYIQGENFVDNTPKPSSATYTAWKNYKPSFWPNSLLNWTDVHPETLAPRTRYLFETDPNAQYGDDLWRYRRIFWHIQCLTGVYPSDFTLVNWPQMDYWVDPITNVGKPLVGPGVSAQDRINALNAAKELSKSLLQWLQTEAPRPEGGYGYPGLRLRPDLMGTTDGFAKTAYIRESRRIKARFTVLEQHVGVAARPGQTSAAVFADSVGIGYYRIDLHPSTGGTTSPGGRTYVDVPSYRFQIPLGAFIQNTNKVKNLLPAAKNIGTTHITNGCYRLHPVEWNIGEAAGALAAYCLAKSSTTTVRPADVWGTGNPTGGSLLAEFQTVIRDRLGILTRWPDVLPQEYPDGRPYGGGG